MKFHFFILILFNFLFAEAQQNLVPNGSFEEYSVCPSGLNQVSNAIGWSSFRYTPDYLSECATSIYTWVPQNQNGYQFAFEGIAYSGYFSYIRSFPDYHEFIGIKLTSPLQTGNLYFISFRACAAIDQNSSTCLATNHIGACFTNTLYDAYNLMPINNNPAIEYPFIISDTTNWTLVSGWYVPDSNYSYLVLGNFFDNALTDTINVTKYINPNFAYCYIDSVSVIQEFQQNISLTKNIEPQVFGIPSNEYCVASMGTHLISRAEVINLLGQQMSCSTIKESNRIIIETSQIPSGSYLVKLHEREKTWTFPLIVQH